jgi:UDP-N-acetyl-D-mannosaminuronate dehydrogenase
MPSYVVNELAVALDLQQKKELNSSSILLVGFAYKKNRITGTVLVGRRQNSCRIRKAP